MKYTEWNESTNYFSYGSDAVTITYWWDNGEHAFGQFAEHTADYEYILKMDEEYTDDDDFWDAILGDAYNVPTHITDVDEPEDTDYWENTLDHCFADHSRRLVVEIASFVVYGGFLPPIK